MGTVVGVRLRDGVALAADKRATSESAVRSESLQKLFDYDAAGAVAAGEPSAIGTFGRRLETEIRTRQTEQGTTIRIDPLARIAGDLASETGVEAVVAARDGELVARVRAIDSSGGELAEEVLAQGTGAQFALGQLDGIDRELSVREADERLESLLRRVAERDTETGEEIDVWTLEDG
ncbi:MAG: 20S proteasome subunit A/B [Halalkalicoccus sp.]